MVTSAFSTGDDEASSTVTWTVAVAPGNVVDGLAPPVVVVVLLVVDVGWGSGSERALKCATS
jgi:hypothetical protein